MDQILSDLKNPAWWFTAFVFATIVNVIGGFMKDRIGSYLARHSERLRSRRAEHQAKRDAAIQSLANDGAYLNAALTHSMAAFVISSIFVIAFLLYLQTGQIKASLCDIKPVLDGCGRLSRLNSTVFTGFLGLFSLWFNYKATTRVILAKDGLKAYRAKNGLSPLV